VARRPLERERIGLDGGRRTTQLMRDSLGSSAMRGSLTQALVIAGVALSCHQQSAQQFPPQCYTLGNCSEPYVIRDTTIPKSVARGLVVNQVDMQGIAYAHVYSKVSRREIFTNSKGEFELSKLKPGIDTLQISLAGRKARFVRIVVPRTCGIRALIPFDVNAVLPSY
jgi:hypothetical protein